VGRGRLIIGTGAYGSPPIMPFRRRLVVGGVDLAALPTEDACRLIASLDRMRSTSCFISPADGHRARSSGWPALLRPTVGARLLTRGLPFPLPATGRGPRAGATR
jgi:hypothetical protein